MRIRRIQNFKDYLISDTGVVYSTAKKYCKINKKRFKKSLWLCFGYLATNLNKRGIKYKKFVHRLVLETFVGTCPEGYQCRHLDGNPLNNNLQNLTWGTRSENQMDRIKNGKDNRGERHGMSKLNKKDVLEIRRLAKINISKFKRKRNNDIGSGYKSIANRYRISPGNVGSIVRKNTWGWL